MHLSSDPQSQYFSELCFAAVTTGGLSGSVSAICVHLEIKLFSHSSLQNRDSNFDPDLEFDWVILTHLCLDVHASGCTFREAVPLEPSPQLYVF